MNFISNLKWIDSLILLLLGLSTLVGILDYVGILPPFIRNFIRLNRSSDTIEALKRLGVDIDTVKRSNASHRYPKYATRTEIEKTVSEELEKHTIDRPVAVGRHKIVELDKYYDLIGLTTDRYEAEYFAQLLVSYWQARLLGDDKIEECDFDFVVTPKGGSPILGYEFAKIVQKPFVLHEEQERFKGASKDMRSVFDCMIVPKEGTTALIVDDSTTGGRMVADAASALRKFGYNVHTCLVVFEPQNKDARTLLTSQNIQLISIVQTHKKTDNKRQ